MYEIDKNVPIPAPSKAARFPYEALDVNDSFKVTGVSLQSVCNSNYRMSKKTGKKFIARAEDGGVRVWRTE
ncbi:MAG: hypothetical protein EBS53_07700 [Bacteroidetes bacterium]|jgi:hypothetical protein|nr:hypothetical protein [Bacteroidota bacterium]